jgi:hypothetical protein
MNNPPPRTDSIPVYPGRHDRRDDTRASLVDQSPRTPGQFPLIYPQARTSGRQQVLLDGGYEESLSSADIYPGYESSKTTWESQGRRPSTNPSLPSTTYTQDISQLRNPTISAPHSGNQSLYTREDVQKMVAQKLKDQGHTLVTRAKFDQAVDEALRRIQQEQEQEQEQEQAQPPHAKTPNT